MTCAASSPTLGGFLAFIRSQMGIPVADLPDSDPSIELAFCLSLETVNLMLASVSALIYQQAVYNLAADILVNIASDQQGHTYFKCLRENFGINNFTGGIISSTIDNGTGSSMMLPDFMKQFTLSDLQNLKTPWGRTYLMWAQKTGTSWGIS